MHTTHASHAGCLPDHTPPRGLLRWLTTTNHKDIGTLYLLFALLMFFVGGAMILVVRAELFRRGCNCCSRNFSTN